MSETESNSNGASLGPENNPLWSEIDRLSSEIEPQVIIWRRDIHQHPELGNREVRTAELVAGHLENLGMNVETEVAHTGVVGVLHGKKDGPVVALRADMDALPITETTDLSFASKVKTDYNGKTVGVMHACGHDCHTSILMGVAEVLSKLREEIPGTVKFIFQPAEDGRPLEEEGGAELMVCEGVLDSPKPGAIFGLHVVPLIPVGCFAYQAGPVMASADVFFINVRGRGGHGGRPWDGDDTIVAASQIVLGLQMIVSRRVNLTRSAAVITVGRIRGGSAGNVMPENVEMQGTIRCFDPSEQDKIHKRIRETSERIAQAAGVTAEVLIHKGYPVTYNDPVLTESMDPVFKAIGTVLQPGQTTGAEDFSYFQEKVPGLYFYLGVAPEGETPSDLHTPKMMVNEDGLVYGVRALAHLAVANLET